MNTLSLSLSPSSFFTRPATLRALFGGNTTRVSPLAAMPPRVRDRACAPPSNPPLFPPSGAPLGSERYGLPGPWFRVGRVERGRGGARAGLPQAPPATRSLLLLRLLLPPARRAAAPKLCGGGGGRGEVQEVRVCELRVLYQTKPAQEVHMPPPPPPPPSPFLSLAASSIDGIDGITGLEVLEYEAHAYLRAGPRRRSLSPELHHGD